MPFNVSLLQPDPDKVLNGVQFPLGADAWIRLAPTWGPRYKEAFRKVSRDYRLAVKAGTLPEHIQQDLHVRAMALGVVLDWGGLEYTDDDGVVRSAGAYSPKKAYFALNRYVGFAAEVEREAGDWRNYR